MTLQECIDAVKRSIAIAKHDAALDILERYASESSNDVLCEKILLLRQRLAVLNDQFLISATITEDEYNAELNQLTVGIIELLKSMQLSQKLPQKGGSLLHNIPPRMRKGQRVKVVVRIAYTDKIAIAGLDRATVTLSTLPRITSLMSVELVDPFDGFEVKSISDEEQATFHDDYTEWQYYVRPLQSGEAILVVKVSAVEEINGQQVPYNVVVEQPVEIIVEAVPELAQVWVNAGLVEMQGTPPKNTPATPAPAMPAPAGVEQPERVNMPEQVAQEESVVERSSKKPLPWGRIGGIAAAILCVILLLPTLTSKAPEGGEISKIVTDDTLKLAPEQIVPDERLVKQDTVRTKALADTSARTAGDTPEPTDMMPKNAGPTDTKLTEKGVADADTAKQSAPVKRPGGFADPYEPAVGPTKRDTTKND